MNILSCLLTWVWKEDNWHKYS